MTSKVSSSTTAISAAAAATPAHAMPVPSFVARAGPGTRCVPPTLGRAAAQQAGQAGRPSGLSDFGRAFGRGGHGRVAEALALRPPGQPPRDLHDMPALIAGDRQLVLAG